MNQHLLLTLGLVAGLTLSASAAKKDPAATPTPKPAAGAAATPAPKTDAPKEEAGKPIPFHGKVTAVDAAAKTFSLKGKDKDRVFAVTDETSVIGKDGAAATLAAVPVGEEVRGSAMKAGDNWTAKKVIVGAKEPATPKGKAAAATPAAPAPATPAKTDAGTKKPQ